MCRLPTPLGTGAPRYERPILDIRRLVIQDIDGRDTVAAALQGASQR